MQSEKPQSQHLSRRAVHPCQRITAKSFLPEIVTVHAHLLVVPDAHSTKPHQDTDKFLVDEGRLPFSKAMVPLLPVVDADVRMERGPSHL